MWDADKYEVMGLVFHNDVQLGEIEMKYSGEASQFSGTVKANQKGVYKVTVYAYDKANGNTGLDSVNFIIQ